MKEQIAAAWASIDDYDGREEAFRELIFGLADQLPQAEGDFERACAWDSTGYSDKAVPLYQSALDGGISGLARRRAVIQISSSLRNIGQVNKSIELLEAERDRDPSLLDDEEKALADAVSATLALCYATAGRAVEGVSVAVAALAKHLPRYQRSMANYARLLTE